MKRDKYLGKGRAEHDGRETRGVDVIEFGLAEFTFANDPQPSAAAMVRVNGVDLRALVGEAVRQGPISSESAARTGHR